MRIVTAIERLKSAFGGSIKVDQLVIIETTTVFPEITDAETSARLLYYCYGGEWAFVSACIEESFAKTLAAIRPEEDELCVCREQIELFHRTYFHPPQARLFDDPRTARIPLVNLFRYYALWLYISENSATALFNQGLVEQSFRARIEGAFTRYLALVNHLKANIDRCSRDGDLPHLIEGLVWMRRIMDIPPASLGRERAATLVDVISGSVEIEARISNTILPEKRAAIERCRKALQTPCACAGEVGNVLSVNWSQIEDFRTTDAEVNLEYSNVVRRTLTMSCILAVDAPFGLCVSDEVRLNELLGTHDLASLLTRLSAPTGVAVDGIIQYLAEHLLLLDPIPDQPGEGSAARHMFARIDQRLRTRLYPENPLHTLTLLHLFLTMYVTGLQTDGMSDLRDYCEASCLELDSILADFEALSVANCRALEIRLSHAWNEWNPPFGFIYHFWKDLGAEILKSSPEDSRVLSHNRYGISGERVLTRFVDFPLPALFSKCVSYARELGNSDWASQSSARRGFIVTVENSRVTPVTQDPEPTFSVNMSVAWKDRYAEYKAVRADKRQLDTVLKNAKEKARGLCEDVLAGSAVELKESFGKRRSLESDLVERLVIIGLEQSGLIDVDRRMALLGWSPEKNPKWSDWTVQWGAFCGYFNQRGFVADDREPFCERSFLLPHEKGWLKRGT